MNRLVICLKNKLVCRAKPGRSANCFRAVSNFIVLIGMLFSVVACYEPVEGCLNPRASNFDLDADEACSDCCTLPELKITFNAVWNDGGESEALRLDTFYTDALDQAWRFKRLRFYWSGLTLEKTDGNLLLIRDSLDVAIVTGADTSTIVVRDDIVLVDIDGASGRFTVGTIEANGFMSRLNGLMGIAQPINSAVTTSVPTGHPLSPQLGKMNFGADKGYVFAKLEYFQDTIATDTTAREINILGDDALLAFTLDLPLPMQLVEGFDQILLIEQDIARLFEGINVRLADTSALKVQFVENLAQSFQLLEVSPE
jgi:hypothetical protein